MSVESRSHPGVGAPREERVRSIDRGRRRRASRAAPSRQAPFAPTESDGGEAGDPAVYDGRIVTRALLAGAAAVWISSVIGCGDNDRPDKMAACRLGAQASAS